MFRCKVCGTLISGYPCPVCRAKPMTKQQLLRLNPPPSAVPTGKRKFVGYCNNCDITIVRAYPFERCSYCGSRVHSA